MLRRRTYGIKEVLTDYELKIYYNHYLHAEIITDLQERIQDQYYKSCGHTNFDSVYGIVLKADRVEKIVEKTIGLQDGIKQREKTFKAHRGLLQSFKKRLTDKQCEVIDRYFYEQYHNNYIISDPVIDLMKELLYVDESKARSERESDRLRQKYEKTLNKAQVMKKEIDKNGRVTYYGGGGEYDDDNRKNSYARRTFGGVSSNS